MTDDQFTRLIFAICASAFVVIVTLSVVLMICIDRGFVIVGKIMTNALRRERGQR